jgi:dipeptidyl aminopeptidase/acylaminoacyl peptidase
MLIIHSDDDESVPVRQAHDMVAELEEAGVKHKFVHYKDRGHMRLTDEVVKEILEAAPVRFADRTRPPTSASRRNDAARGR